MLFKLHAVRLSNLKLHLAFDLATVLLVNLVSGQNLLPNPDFEEGRQQPTGWQLVGTAGCRPMMGLRQGAPGTQALCPSTWAEICDGSIS